MGWIFTVIVLGMLVGFISVWRRGLQLRDLVNDGIPLNAKIEKIWTFGGRQKAKLRFQYQIDNKKYSRAVAISMTEYEQLKQGDNVNIVYLPSKPAISALASMVALASKGLKKNE